MRKDMMGKVKIIKKPVSIITSFSESTIKYLLNLQAEYMLKQLDTVLLKNRALSQVDSPKETINNQLKYFEDLTNDLSEITGKEIHFLKFYKNKLIDTLEKNMKEIPLISVSYRVTEGDQISVVNVQQDDVTMSVSHMNRVALRYSGEHHV